MATIRSYTADEVRELVEFFRDDPEVSAERFAGMAFVADALKQLETMTDADIEAVVRRWMRSPDRD